MSFARRAISDSESSDRSENSLIVPPLKPQLPPHEAACSALMIGNANDGFCTMLRKSRKSYGAGVAEAGAPATPRVVFVQKP